MKKIGLLTLLIMATFLFALAFTVAAGPRVPVAHAAAMPAPHVHIHASLEAMRNARHELGIAEHAFEGHRDKAIEHLDAAIHEAEICESMP